MIINFDLSVEFSLESSLGFPFVKFALGKILNIQGFLLRF